MIPPDIRADNEQFIAEMKAAGTPVCEQGCFIQLPADGVCRICEPVERPADVLAARAAHDGWGENWHMYGPEQTYEEVRAARLVVEAYEQIEREVERDAKIPANGCRWCGILQHEHGNRWIHGTGYHLWAAPDDATRLGRMRARRAGADMRLWREVNRRWNLRADPGAGAGEVR